MLTHRPHQLIICLIFAICRTSAAVDWFQFTSGNQDFSVRFPETPTVQENTSSGGHSFQQVFCRVPGGDLLFVTSVLPEKDERSVVEVMDAVRDGVIASCTEGSLLSESKVVIDGIPGRDFCLTGSHEGVPMYARYRILISDRKLYQQMITRESAANIEMSVADQFFGTLMIKTRPPEP